MCKVSIVVPIYNPGKKLNKCIKSILSQTFSDFELILVNDGSTDDSIDICNKYANQDNRIVIIDKENEGSIAARKRGIEEAKSGYIMFVDADDWVDNNILEVLYNELIKHNCDITVCNQYKALGDNAIIKRKNKSIYFLEDKLYEGDIIRTELVEAYLHGHPFPPGLVCKLYKRNLLINSGVYLKKIKFLGEDLFYNLEIFLKANRIKVISRPLYYYRVGGFTSKFMPHHFEDIVNGYKIQKEVIEMYYQDSIEKRHNGISVMLLNSFKSTLENIVSSNFNEKEIKNNILLYVENSSIQEVLKNKASKKCFEKEFLDAIENKNIEYLYSLGNDMYNKSKLKRNLVSIIAKLNIL